MAIPKYTRVAIRSKEFGTYLSLNGTGVNHFRDGGWPNTVKTIGHLKSWETFYVHHNDDNTVSFEATQFPNAYLRLDGNGVRAGVNAPGGTVNTQYGSLGWEKFHIRRQDDSTPIVAIESASFPGRFLRVDNRNVANVQGVNLSWEKFEIFYLPPKA